MSTGIKRQKIAQNCTKKDRFQWSTVKEKAVHLVYADRLTDAQIAAKLKIGVRTLARWKLEPSFQDRRQELQEAYLERVHRRLWGKR